jgi:hypothetical protein
MNVPREGTEAWRDTNPTDEGPTVRLSSRYATRYAIEISTFSGKGKWRSLAGRED